jgi:hypothetical protein
VLLFTFFVTEGFEGDVDFVALVTFVEDDLEGLEV